MRVRKLPVEVQAEKVHLGNIDAVAQWCNAVLKVREDNFEPYLCIFTLEGAMNAYIGDWIVRGVNGEFYPCKHDIFIKTYEILGNDDPATEFVAPVFDVLAVSDNEDGSATFSINIDRNTLIAFAKEGLLSVIRDEAERVIKEQAE